MSDHDMIMAERYTELVEVLAEAEIHFTDLQTIGDSFMFYTRQDGERVVSTLEEWGVEAGWNYSYETPYTTITCHMPKWFRMGDIDRR